MVPGVSWLGTVALIKTSVQLPGVAKSTVAFAITLFVVASLKFTEQPGVPEVGVPKPEPFIIKMLPPVPLPATPPLRSLITGFDHIVLVPPPPPPPPQDAIRNIRII